MCARLWTLPRAGLERAVCDETARPASSQALRLAGLLTAGRPRPVDEFAGMTVEQALEKQVRRGPGRLHRGGLGGLGTRRGARRTMPRLPRPSIPAPLFPPAPTATVVPWPARPFYPPGGRPDPEGPAVVLPFPERP